MNPKPTETSLDRRFIARFAVFCVMVVMLYVAGVTFIEIPITGAKYADIAVPILVSSVFVAIVTFVYRLRQPPKDEPPVDKDAP